MIQVVRLLVAPGPASPCPRASASLSERSDAPPRSTDPTYSGMQRLLAPPADDVVELHVILDN